MDESIFKKAFYGIVLASLIILPALSTTMGVNGDEKYQVYISDHILDYYTSLGKDRALFVTRDEAKKLRDELGREKAAEIGITHIPPQNNLMYYGGIFEFLSAITNKVLGTFDSAQMPYHKVRHFLLALIGVLIILFTGLIAKELAGWRAAFIAALLLLITPRFVGHSLMNPKDIPFALGYVMSLYFMLRFFKERNDISWKAIAGLIGGIAIAINVRIGGVLLAFYFVMFSGLTVAYYAIIKKDEDFVKNIKKFLGAVVLVCVLGYFLGLIFWPYGLSAPLSKPIEAFGSFSKFEVALRQLFEGQHIMSDELPWYYLPKYLAISNPVVVLLGFTLFVVLSFAILKWARKDLIGIVLFMMIFPIAFIIYNKSNVYSGWRHILFVYPLLIALSALGFEQLFRFVKAKYGQLAIALVMIAMMVIPVKWIFANTPYQYVYFNPIVGGPKKAYKDYTTDYWQISIKEASEWLIDNVKSDKKVVVATNCSFPAKIYLHDYQDRFEVKYIRYYERHRHDWDYGLFYVDYIDPDQLKKRIYPPDGTVYTVKTAGAPLCAVIDRSDKSDYLGYQAVTSGNHQEAINQFSKAVRTYPNTSGVYMGLGMAYLNTSQPQKAIQVLSKSAKLYPGSAATYYYLGLAYAQTNEANKALMVLQEAIKLNGRFKQAYQLMGNIYQQQGKTDLAQRYLNAANSL